MGFHCTDCVYSEFLLNRHTGRYQGQCSRGYTLCDPKVRTQPQNRFAEKPEQLVPVIDPFGNEYLRTSNVCERFLKRDAADGPAA